MAFTQKIKPSLKFISSTGNYRKKIQKIRVEFTKKAIK